MFFSPFKDAQCGFKGITGEAAEACIPLVKNNHWFFDTELLIIAAKSGYKIKSHPVHWEDDPDTRVNVTATVTEDLKGLLRLRFGGVPRAPARLARCVVVLWTGRKGSGATATRLSASASCIKAVCISPVRC